MAKALKYPIGIQNFEKIIEGGFVYVDKTQYIKKLLSGGCYYFLSRPRRFGKSLFLSTLQAYFEGKRHLFNGLAIDDADVQWVVRPVIKMSLNTINPDSNEALTNHLDSIFREYEHYYGIELPAENISDRFAAILKAAYFATGLKTAVLIDEYDGPLLSTLNDEILNNSYRETLKSLFSVLKSSDEYIHFAFVTGVSRFSQTSLFSGANNLDDISLMDEYSSICGITEEEINVSLRQGVDEFALKTGKSNGEMMTILKENYDGYHFSAISEDIYNPFSLLHALSKKKITDYWFQSGTPTYLLKVLKRDDFFLPQLDCMESLESNLAAKESYLNHPVSLLYETGYITIKGYDDEKMSYTLGLPNREVAMSFTKALLPIYSGMKESDCSNSILHMRSAVVDGEAEQFMRLLQTFLKGNPYSNTEIALREKFFKNNLYLMLKAIGFFPRNEEETCRARIDVMLRTRQYIYIFELKTDGSAEKAMNQIHDRDYAGPYAHEGRTIIRIAANYSTKDNNIDSWIIDRKQ